MREYRHSAKWVSKRFGLPEFISDSYAETLERMRAKRFADPSFWEHNATLHTHAPFRQACLEYARRLKEKANG